MRAVVAKTELLRSVQRLFGQYDYLVSPTLTRTALDANYDSAKGSVEIDGEQVGSTQAGWTAYMYPFNLTGNPALTVPSGFGDDGLPLGVQIIGPRHADGDVFRLGALLETANPWADKWPEIVR
jgi:aspartyl-tRNA(Asn)/glutamyl-tRNA(Gln) amidotransferase subunit A